MEAPQITSHPECISQCNGRASASGHNPGTWNISYHEDKPGQCENRSLFSELITCSATGILITQSQAIQRPRDERVRCGPKDFPELQTAALVLLFRWWWTIKVTEAAPVCLSQKLFSLFHLNLVGVPIPGVIVGTVLIVSRNFEKGSMFNFLSDFSLKLLPDWIFYAKYCKKILQISQVSKQEKK